MIRRLIVSAALIAPLIPAVVVPGCSDELPLDDLCSWLKNPNNCYARFANDIGTYCGHSYTVGSDPLKNYTGSFSVRDTLDICIGSQGGQVIFDPPLDVTTFPVTSVAFTVLDAQAVACGNGAYNNDELYYAVTINPVDKNDAGAATAPDGGPLGDNILGGSFSVGHPDGRDYFDVTCPGEQENYHFNTYTLEKCKDMKDFVPKAVLDSNPGIPESKGQESKQGYVRLRVYYPPLDPNVTGASPRIVQYFNCLIPAPPPPCADGVKNGDETDIDCGGSCPGKCDSGMSCIKNADCKSGNCAYDAGFKKCA